jgi:hypothetical protein
MPATDGESYSGFLVSKTDDKVVMRDANNRTIEVPAAQVERLTPSKLPLMPELLLRDIFCALLWPNNYRF